MSGLESRTLSVGKLFDRENFFRIPEYQRPFSWNEDNFTELIDDLINAPQGRDYFLGTLVLHSVSRGDGEGVTFDIVDGQQRLTALTILLACIRDSEAVSSEEDIIAQIQDKLRQRAQSLSKIPERERLEVRDPGAFNEVVMKHGGTRGDSVTKLQGYAEKKYRKAIEVFHSRLSRMDLREIDSLAKFIISDCTLVYISAESFEEAFRLFTVVNDRGKQLRRIDILKAENLDPEVIAEPSVRKKYAQTWESMEEEVGESQFEDIFHSLRLAYLKAKPHGDLALEFKKRIFGKPWGPARGTEFLDELKRTQEMYKSLFIDRDYLADTLDGVKFETLMSAMTLEFRASEWKTAVLCCAKKFGKIKLMEFVLAIEKVFLEHWVTGVRKDERYSDYISILKAIESSDTPDEAISYVRYSEKPIRDACERSNFYGTPYSRYLLTRMEIVTSELAQARRFSVKSIEHVLPQNPAPESGWHKTFSEEEMRNLVHSAGNLVLLSKSKNSTAQNHDFDKKKEVYLKPRVTDFPRSVQVLSIADWTPEVITKRTQEFADRVLCDP